MLLIEATEVPTLTTVKTNWQFRGRQYNEAFESGLRSLPVRSCLIRTNSHKVFLQISARESRLNRRIYKRLRLIKMRISRIQKSLSKENELCFSISVTQNKLDSAKYESQRERFRITLANKQRRLKNQKRCTNKRQRTDIIQRHLMDKQNKLQAIYRAKMVIIFNKVRGKFFDRDADSKITIQTVPKWVTLFTYNKNTLDADSGEVLQIDEYLPLYSNNFKSLNAKKIKHLDTFANKYQPLYADKKVSLLFFTFTQANMAHVGISALMQNLQRRAQKQNINVLGKIWTMEVKPNAQMGGFNVHYHMGMALDRLDLAGGKMPDWLKLNRVWGRRTQVAFVKKNVKHYLAKYFAKNNARVEGWRSMGKSLKFN